MTAEASQVQDAAATRPLTVEEALAFTDPNTPDAERRYFAEQLVTAIVGYHNWLDSRDEATKRAAAGVSPVSAPTGDTQEQEQRTAAVEAAGGSVTVAPEATGSATTPPPPAALPANERDELERLRAEHAARLAQAEEAPAPETALSAEEEAELARLRSEQG